MPLKLYDRGGVWWYRGTVAGRRIPSLAGLEPGLSAAICINRKLLDLCAKSALK